MRMLKRSREIQQKLGKALDLPHDMVFNLPKITVIGNAQLYIENHRGIIEYSPEKIRLSVESGEVEICGEMLMIRAINNEDIHLDGVIDAVRFRR